MEDDGEGNLEQAARKGAGGFFTPSRIFMIFLFVFGVIVGLFVQHQIVEPLFNQGLTGGLNECLSSKKLLNQEIQQCYADLQQKDQNNGP
ncbi:MAG: hypothetical protein J4215_06525 [Candidatus Diapherotrites archaeon]|uniref:Uncharacterized protein n=1 Tax=Candidatus Iainarchaeum sp. TaxID=3101447 RepID=A0A8T4L4E9_9ARCH|nr:hypothetical protein [Candidatus Diapherotrites archaeon]